MNNEIKANKNETQTKNISKQFKTIIKNIFTNTFSRNSILSVILFFIIINLSITQLIIIILLLALFLFNFICIFKELKNIKNQKRDIQELKKQIKLSKPGFKINLIITFIIVLWILISIPIIIINQINVKQIPDFVNKTVTQVKQINSDNFWSIKFKGSETDGCSYTNKKCDDYTIISQNPIENTNVDSQDPKNRIITLTLKVSERRLKELADEKQKRIEQEKKEKAEAKKKDEASKRAAGNPITVEWTELFRNSEKYKGKYVRFTGELGQVQADGSDEYTLLIYTKKSEYSNFYYEDDIYVYGKLNKKLIKDDIVEFVAKFDGVSSYNTVMGTSRELPMLVLDKYSWINIIGRAD